MFYTIRQLKSMLVIDKHRLDDELEKQPQISHDIAEAVAASNLEQQNLKEALNRFDAELLLDLRKGDVKLTAGEVQAEIELDPERIVANRLYLEAKRTYEEWVGMYDAWKQRGFSLKTLADLYIASYYAIDSGGRTNDYQKDRAALAEQRQVRRTRTKIG